ncbi:cytochrome P450 [Streptomyces sp. NPDC006368]|uniref:cytochrome P450 n=1 Tax=Streptomyces sp. NPDC006368 TaxID=3156760 RepID=UPI00339FC49E
MTGTDPTRPGRHPPPAAGPHTPVRPSGRDVARLAAQVIAPGLASGGLARRRAQTPLAERYAVDRRASGLLTSLRRRYGPGPLRLDAAGRTFAVLLLPEDARRVLDATPDPYSPATREKAAVPERFQPRGVLMPLGTRRDERRAFNEAVLAYGHRSHDLAPRMVRAVREEAGELLRATTARAGELDWTSFSAAWDRTARRAVIGDTARDDTALTAALDGPHERFERRLRDHLDPLGRARAGSLAGALGTDPAVEAPYWLYAFDSAGIAAFRTLALLATHERQARQVSDELAVSDLTEPRLLPYTRACVLESVRLWPTTPFLLRESVRDTPWGDETLPAGTEFLMYAPLFHRDEALPYSDRFTPEIWLDGTAQDVEALMPFGTGPGEGSGQDLVLLVTSTMLAVLLERRTYRTEPLRADRPLPRTLDHVRLRFVTISH